MVNRKHLPKWATKDIQVLKDISEQKQIHIDIRLVTIKLKL